MRNTLGAGDEDFARRPGWFTGAEAILESNVLTTLQVQGLEAALRKAKPRATAIGSWRDRIRRRRCYAYRHEHWPPTGL